MVKNPPSTTGHAGSISGWETEDPTCLGATKPVHHSYWTTLNNWESVLQQKMMCDAQELPQATAKTRNS